MLGEPGTSWHLKRSWLTGLDAAASRVLNGVGLVKMVTKRRSNEDVTQRADMKNEKQPILVCCQYKQCPIPRVLNVFNIFNEPLIVP